MTKRRFVKLLMAHPVCFDRNSANNVSKRIKGAERPRIIEAIEEIEELVNKVTPIDLEDLDPFKQFGY